MQCMKQNKKNEMGVKIATNPVAAPPPRPLDKSRCNRSKHKGADTRSCHTETWEKNNQLMLELGTLCICNGGKKNFTSPVAKDSLREKY